METRCRIGLKLNDGTVKSIYCHHDGYFEGVGRTLRSDYTDHDKVEALINLGSISSLGETLENTIAYSRDFNEKYDRNSPNRESEEEFFENEFQYLYLFSPESGTWKFYKP